MTFPSRRRAMGAAAALTAALAGAVAAPATARAASSSGGGVVPLRRAHAHNDYEHDRPLHDALAHGFTSVEADIWLVDGQLLVAHDEWQLDPSRTLEALYLDPLLARVRANHGRVYRGHDVSLQLLIDIKNTGDATYRELARRLRPYHSLFSKAVGGRVQPRAVTAVISGDRAARVPMEAERIRHTFYDGRLDDLLADPPAPASFIPLISANWNSGFTWQGIGPMPAAERELLRRITGTAHARGQRVRFWATPDLPGPARDAVWRELVAADVDHLNTDDLAGLEAFLRAADAG
ncbi:phosphatidylinositol-specific phospholipase C/glycerophosphodiester phosphodiesterase family protein [Streptomyces sp. NBC_01803]|uniref:phosphatidylinositol-specific phospholipase C/glycerophosphodiester phosphodiesterase family protein n=1 Tax=Streptomyces sp. NBC_01803 TaxID=2975946 RepID=UPI002DD8EEA0|nr:phosphatidylinositol-specific phospholipase C/glycerophosphodiester phosphodiesterase family protein [Streptomyces sp. NBC_01803]WSA45569.1 phosphatidylinositol-specific phospholipase C/glycerophosphodiester phosphodiesterase family protein [Streptomyces sp. NBC_01803]